MERKTTLEKKKVTEILEVIDEEQTTRLRSGNSTKKEELKEETLESQPVVMETIQSNLEIPELPQDGEQLVLNAPDSPREARL